MALRQLLISPCSEDDPQITQITKCLELGALYLVLCTSALNGHVGCHSVILSNKSNPERKIKAQSSKYFVICVIGGCVCLSEIVNLHRLDILS